MIYFEYINCFKISFIKYFVKLVNNEFFIDRELNINNILCICR